MFMFLFRSPGKTFFLKHLTPSVKTGLVVGLVVLFAPSVSYGHIGRFLTRARTLFLHGEQAGKISNLLEDNRVLYLAHANPLFSPGVHSNLLRQANTNRSLLRVLARRDPIALQEGVQELALVTHQRKSLEELLLSVGESAEAAAFLQAEQAFLKEAQTIAEIRLLAAEVRAQGEEGVQKVRKKLQAQWEQVRAHRDQGSGVVEEANKIEEKLNHLLQLEITMSGAVTQQFATKSPIMVLHEAQRSAMQQKEKFFQAEQRLRSAQQSQTGLVEAQSNLHTAYKARNLAEQYVVVVQDEAAAWAAALHAS